MSFAPKVSRDEVDAIIRMVDLTLGEERLDQLVTTLSGFLGNLERLRAIDPKDSEPPTITYGGEDGS